MTSIIGLKQRVAYGMRTASQFVLLSVCMTSGCAQKSDRDEVLRTKYFHTYGPELSKESWDNHGMTGEVIEQCKSGIEIRKKFLDGKLHGESTWSYPHSPVAHRFEEYEMGRLVSFGVNYDNGVVEIKEELSPKGNKILQAWYDDGCPRFTEEWSASQRLQSGKYFTDTGDLESEVIQGKGVRVDRNRAGALLVRERVEQGQVVEKQAFFPNGTIQSVVLLQNGIQHGTTHVYLESGQPLSIEEWKNGTLDGMQTYFDHGLRAIQISYKNGLREGVETRFKPGTDQIVAKISWKNDLKQGPATFFLDDQEVQEWYWKDGKVSEEQYRIRQKQLDNLVRR